MDAILKTTSPNLKISFPKVSITTPGQNVSKQDCEPGPILSLKSATASKTYIAIALDPDAPFPSMPLLSPILHGIQAGLRPDGGPDSEGWVKLKASEPPVADWLAPTPPKISAAHKYLFLVWEQPDGLTGENIRKEKGWAEKVGLSARTKWNQEAFESTFKLGQCIGGNWFLCG